MFIKPGMTFSDVENPETSKVVGRSNARCRRAARWTASATDYLGGFQIAIAANAPQRGGHDFIAFLTSDEGQAIMLDNGAPDCLSRRSLQRREVAGALSVPAPVKDAEVLLPLTSDFAGNMSRCSASSMTSCSPPGRGTIAPRTPWPRRMPA
jgi:sorbitol/mannitol transport system substrate-binding protein